MLSLKMLLNKLCEAPHTLGAPNGMFIGSILP
jgi:hypothetical protein